MSAEKLERRTVWWKRHMVRTQPLGLSARLSMIRQFDFHCEHPFPWPQQTPDVHPYAPLLPHVLKKR